MSKVWGTSCEASQLLRNNDVNIGNDEMHQTMHLHFSVFSTSFVLISWRRLATATQNSRNVQGKEVSNGIQAYSGYVSYKTHQNSLGVDQTTWPTRHRICMEHLHPLVHWSINIVTELAIQKVLRDNRNRHCETSKQQLRTTLTVDIKVRKISKSADNLRTRPWCMRTEWHTMTRSPAFAYWPMPWAWLESAGNFTASKREPSKAQP